MCYRVFICSPYLECVPSACIHSQPFRAVQVFQDDLVEASIQVWAHDVLQRKVTPVQNVGQPINRDSCKRTNRMAPIHCIDVTLSQICRSMTVFSTACSSQEQGKHQRKHMLAEWRSGSVSALPCERPGFGPRTRLREIIPANNCTMQGQNNWGNWGSPGVMKLWVAWEVLRWLMKLRELCSGDFHPKLVTPPYHGFLNVNTPPNSQKFKTALSATQYASPRREA